MKALAMILTLILAQQVLASNSCFDTQAVKDLIKASEEINDCFSSDNNDCDLVKMEIAHQKDINSQRLIPNDRKAGNGFMDRTTGIVSVKFAENKYGQASGQKISRCHVITSAHLLYTDAAVSVNTIKFEMGFLSGQTCDQKIPFEKRTGASLLFKMTDESKGDFRCLRMDKYGKCRTREFHGHNDLVILKLDKFDKTDKSFFTLNTSNPNSFKNGQRVNCWGYPAHNANIKLSAAQTSALMWSQKDAQIFGDGNGRYYNGTITNAIAYKGMSGGGCSTSQNPTELVGVFANQNSANGHSAIDVGVDKVVSNGANHLSGFHELAERYRSATGKNIADLDNECE